MGHPTVLDADYNEKSFEWADQWYGVGYRRAQPNADGWVYRLVVLQEKKGHSSSLVTQVLDQDGLPIEEANVALWWTGAPDPPEPPTEVYDHDHYPNFVHGLTNANGDVGPGMGPGAYIDIDPDTGYVIIDRDQDGPHAVWVRDPNIPSDICVRLGMRGGSHDHMDQKFQLVHVNGNGEPPDVFFVQDGPPLEEAGTSARLRMAWPRGKHYDTATRGGIVGGQELETSDLEAWEHNGKKYVISGLCCDFEGDSPREFWMEIHAVPPPYPALSDKVQESFSPSPDHRIITYVMKVESEELPPSPSPEPPPSGWTMTVEKSDAPGLRLLIGKMPQAGITVSVCDPWGNCTQVVSGSKPDYGIGGWEVVAWASTTFTISFLDESFQVEVGNNEAVICTFEEGEPTESQARLVSPWMAKSEAEAELEELQNEGFDYFSLEEA